MTRASFIQSLLRICTFFCAFSFSCFAYNTADNNASANEKLQNVKSEISETKSVLESVNKKRKKLENQLKANELAISRITNKINTNDKNKRLIKTTLKTLQKRKAVLSTNKKRQEKLLAKQLRAAYSAGHHDYIKLLLNQKNPAKIQRTITQYQYINNARIKEIDNFKQIIDELVIIEEQNNVQSVALNAVTLELIENKKSLQQNKQTRTETLALIKKEQLSTQQQLAKLISEEKSLTDTLKKLEAIAKSTKDLTGLAKLKRKLKWPISGKLIHKFGTQKQGYIKWKGVLAKAKLGQEVKSIYNGEVLFSDWLQGYGLVTIIDHGKGYMSLYGHNQTLLKKVGDYVEQGEPISLAGQSGGQSEPVLYFEIRHAGRAQNPKLWCK